jgi:hypothetical protein
MINTESGTPQKIVKDYGYSERGTAPPSDPEYINCDVTVAGSIYMLGTPTMIGNYKWALNWAVTPPATEKQGGSIGFYANGIWVFGERFTVDSTVFEVGNTSACEIKLMHGSSLTCWEGSQVKVLND